MGSWTDVQLDIYQFTDLTQKCVLIHSLIDLLLQYVSPWLMVTHTDGMDTVYNSKQNDEKLKPAALCKTTTL